MLSIVSAKYKHPIIEAVFHDDIGTNIDKMSIFQYFMSIKEHYLANVWKILANYWFSTRIDTNSANISKSANLNNFGAI